MQIKKIIDKISDKVFEELNNKETMDIMNIKIFKPIIDNIFVQIYPYIIFFSIIILSLFIILISILFLNIKSLYK
jgi:hypothetical protein|tara:strand:+ start:526 stop:750 length:225 start_codon:yes stop_codon:yes gene_type:complete